MILRPSFRVPVAPPLYSVERQVDEWNIANAIGESVVVRRLSGNEETTRTISQAWMINCYSAGVMLEGIGVPYPLDRVRPNTPISNG